MTPSPTVPLETTLQVRDSCLCLHAQRAARVLARRFDEALRPVGLTNGQFSLLMSLNGPEAAPMGRVAALLGADRTTLTAALKPLVRDGLAVVSVDPDDNRMRRIGLTPAGHARLLEALPIWTRTHAAVDAGLGGSDPERLRADLRNLSAPPARTPAPPVQDPGVTP